jgi:DNA-directed RNA polymerase subunit RPC12/RpoP
LPKPGKDEIVTDSDAVIDLEGTQQARFTSAEQAGLARAVRASIRSQVIDLLDRHGLLHKSDLQRCPVCGDKVIVLEQPGTFVYDRARDRRICAACGAERDLLVILDPVVEIGGEG